MGQRLLAALAEIRDELDLDPLFRGKRYTIADVAPLLERGSDDDLGALFGDTLQGMIQSARYGGIKVVHQLHRDERASASLPALTVAKGETKVFVGDLRIDGDLENNGILVVTGDLDIGGRHIGPTFSYSLAAVGGTMKARHVTTSGEVLVGQGLDATGVVHFIHNDYSAVLPRISARALVVEDSFPVLGEVVVAARVQGRPSDDQLREWFGGIPAAGDDEEESSRVRTMILAGWQPNATSPKSKPKAKAKSKSKSKPKAKAKAKVKSRSTAKPPSGRRSNR